LIDDTKKNRRPIQYVSFYDLENLGFDVYVQEFNKQKPDGSQDTAVKVVKVTKEGGEFSKQDMKDFLYILGIDTYDSTFWVTPKKKHRALSSEQPVYHYRYMGYERKDEQWLKSGRASQEAIMYASNMPDMSEQAHKMRHGGAKDD